MRRPRSSPRRRAALTRLPTALLVAWVAAGCATSAGAPVPSESAPTIRASTPAASPTAVLPSVALATSTPVATVRPPTPTPTPSPTPAPLGQAPVGPTEPARVVRVVDGDTIIIDRGRGDERLRYIGVDTPETVHPTEPVEWMGAEASAANRELVEGREVVLERDVSETDQYDRLLRYVWVRDGDGWTMVNLALLAGGFAQVVTYPPDVRYVDLFLVAQGEARDAGRGLWGAPPPEPEPEPQPEPPLGADCDPAYPTVCIPPAPPDLDCGEIPHRRFQVRPPDPHGFDGNHDGVGCESG